ncbi:hypothetical protein MRX96_038238 [Rhipicephalus microplus]
MCLGSNEADVLERAKRLNRVATRRPHILGTQLARINNCVEKKEKSRRKEEQGPSLVCTPPSIATSGSAGASSGRRVNVQRAGNCGAHSGSVRWGQQFTAWVGTSLKRLA